MSNKDLSPHSSTYQIIPYYLEKKGIRTYLEIHNQNDFSGIYNSFNDYHNKLTKKDNINVGVWQEVDEQCIIGKDLDYEFIFINLIKYIDSNKHFRLLKEVVSRAKIGTTIFVNSAYMRYQPLIDKKYYDYVSWEGCAFESCLNLYNLVNNKDNALNKSLSVRIIDGNLQKGFMVIKKSQPIVFKDNISYEKYDNVNDFSKIHKVLSTHDFLKEEKLLKKYETLNNKNNLFVIIGCLKNKDVSNYSFEERVYATKLTFDSIITFNKNPTITYFDPSVSQKEIDTIYSRQVKNNSCISLHSLMETECPSFIGNKQSGEIMSTYNSIKILKNLQSNKKIIEKFDNIFKITGRYNLSNRFDDTLFLDNNYPISGLFDGSLMQTFFYRVRSLKDWEKAMHLASMYIKNEKKLDISMPMWGDKPWVETLIPYCFGGDTKVNRVTVLGCQGYIAPGGEHIR